MNIKIPKEINAFVAKTIFNIFTPRQAISIGMIALIVREVSRLGKYFRKDYKDLDLLYFAIAIVGGLIGFWKSKGLHFEEYFLKLITLYPKNQVLIEDCEEL